MIDEGGWICINNVSSLLRYWSKVNIVLMEWMEKVYKLGNVKTLIKFNEQWRLRGVMAESDGGTWKANKTRVMIGQSIKLQDKLYWVRNWKQWENQPAPVEFISVILIIIKHLAWIVNRREHWDNNTSSRIHLHAQ